jgi:hypothetical protein
MNQEDEATTRDDRRLPTVPGLQAKQLSAYVTPEADSKAIFDGRVGADTRPYA